MNTFSPTQHSIEPSQKRSPMEYYPPGSSITVVGAGAFGGWTALMLQRKGYKVSLLDQFGSGNSRSSSGGETRLMRCIYGENPFYTSLANRAYGLWQENESKFGRQYLYPTGCLWFSDTNADDMVKKALPVIENEGLDYDVLSPEETQSKFPLINPEDCQVIHEKKTGYLKAREGCIAVKELFEKEGGLYLQKEIRPQDIIKDKSESDCYIFACGPWLKQLFPDLLGDRLTITRQEVFYFGLSTEYAAAFESLPTWIDHSPPHFYYGIPGGINRGFKIAFDRRGEEVDPNLQERLVSPQEVEQARAYIKRRFKGAGELPLVESRVCQYSDTGDGNFIFDQHPNSEKIWLLGGGSGHGYKHGPAVGELVSQVLSGEKPKVPDWVLR